MTYEEFDKILKDIKLSKKDFAKVVKMSYTGVTNWKQTKNVPDWIESWLQNYQNSEKLKKIQNLLKEEL